MTIKIIKHGGRRKVECLNCGCIFSYEKEDIRTVTIGYNEYVDNVYCPECGEKLKVAEY